MLVPAALTLNRQSVPDLRSLCRADQAVYQQRKAARSCIHSVDALAKERSDQPCAESDYSELTLKPKLSTIGAVRVPDAAHARVVRNDYTRAAVTDIPPANGTTLVQHRYIVRTALVKWHSSSKSGAGLPPLPLRQQVDRSVQASAVLGPERLELQMEARGEPDATTSGARVGRLGLAGRSKVRRVSIL